MPFDAAWIARSGVLSMHVREVVDVALGNLLVGERQVVVRVDEAGEHGQAGEVDHLGARGDGDLRPIASNLLSFIRMI